MQKEQASHLLAPLSDTYQMKRQLSHDVPQVQNRLQNRVSLFAEDDAARNQAAIFV